MIRHFPRIWIQKYIHYDVNAVKEHDQVIEWKEKQTCSARCFYSNWMKWKLILVFIITFTTHETETTSCTKGKLKYSSILIHYNFIMKYCAVKVSWKESHIIHVLFKSFISNCICTPQAEDHSWQGLEMPSFSTFKYIFMKKMPYAVDMQRTKYPLKS